MLRVLSSTGNTACRKTLRVTCWGITATATSVTACVVTLNSVTIACLINVVENVSAGVVTDVVVVYVAGSIRRCCC